jgi:hypothetical protein
VAHKPRYAGVVAHAPRKYVNHPQAGPLEFECQVLHIAGTGQRLITYCAAPGSATEAAFRQLAARTAREAAGQI